MILKEEYINQLIKIVVTKETFDLMGHFILCFDSFPFSVLFVFLNNIEF